MVEGDGFVELLHYLEPGCKVPSRKHVTKMIQKHVSIREKLQAKLDKEATSISLTTDIWTSAGTEATLLSLHTIFLQNGSCFLVFKKPRYARTTHWPKQH